MSARHYKRAPIREAVIEVRVRPRADLKFQELRSVQEDVRADYPTCDEILMVRGTMQVQASGSASALAEQDRIGFKLASVDGKQVCMPRLEAFALSRLAPYDRWEPFRNEAKPLWSV